MKDLELSYKEKEVLAKVKVFCKRRPLLRQGRPTGIRITGTVSSVPGGGGLLDHLYAPRHPPSAPPTEERQGVNSQTACIGCKVKVKDRDESPSLYPQYYEYG